MAIAPEDKIVRGGDLTTIGALIKAVIDSIDSSSLRNVSVTVDGNVGTPYGSAYMVDDTIYFSFGNLKGPQGATGPQGVQGLQGNSGYSGAAGELELVNNLVDGGETSALSAEMGKVLNAKLETANVAEDGFFFVDKYLNVGVRITDDGLTAFNSITFEEL